MTLSDNGLKKRLKHGLDEIMQERNYLELPTMPEHRLYGMEPALTGILLTPASLRTTQATITHQGIQVRLCRSPGGAISGGSSAIATTTPSPTGGGMPWDYFQQTGVTSGGQNIDPVTRQVTSDELASDLDRLLADSPLAESANGRDAVRQQPRIAQQFNGWRSGLRGMGRPCGSDCTG